MPVLFLLSGIMKTLVNVAISGPLKRTFTYHLPDGMELPIAGQRILVPFGRQQTTGFYLNQISKQPQFETKPVTKFLDSVSYFSKEMFDLCLWIASYYFVNPADCLSAALPPVFKSRKSATLIWNDDSQIETPATIKSIYNHGKRISPKAILELERMGKNKITELIKAGVITEDWLWLPPAVNVLQGFKVNNSDSWDNFFSRKKFQPELFEDIKNKEELFKSGWTSHYINEAVKAEIIKKVYNTKPDHILDFVSPKEGVANLSPNSEQQTAIDTIASDLQKGFKTFLLHGVTGSGKTLVYCHLAEKVLALGKTVLIMTPEIALTGTTLAYLRGFFGDEVTVLHSAMSQRERLESWRGIRLGKYRIVVGPRSALFAPLPDIGFIVVDEEHDSSYKQNDPSPRFHGRDAAIMRAQFADIPIVLGSASPSIESYYNASSGRYSLISQ